MEKLLIYLNGLARQDQDDFARQCGTSVNYLRKAISTKSQLGAELCSSIELHSDRAITRQDLRPDSWQRIWPELAAHA